MDKGLAQRVQRKAGNVPSFGKKITIAEKKFEKEVESVEKKVGGAERKFEKEIANAEKKIERAEKKVEKELLDVPNKGNKKTPLFIKILKILLILGALVSLMGIFKMNALVSSLVSFVLSLIWLYGLQKRKKWAFSLGILIFVITIIGSIVEGGYIYSAVALIFGIFFYKNRNFLDR